MKCKESKFRTWTLLDLASLGVGNAIGVGIFVLLGELTRNAAGPAVVVSIVISGLTAILIGLCLAECGTRFVRADTTYTYSYSYHGENVAFIFGWVLMLEFIAGSASVAKGVLTFIDALTESQISNYLKDFVPLKSEFGIPYLDFFSPVIIVIVVLAVLVFKLIDLTMINNLVTGFTVILVLSIIIAGSIKADLTNWNINENTTDFEKSFAPFGYLGVLKGAAVGFYGYVGFDTICITGKEVKNPQVSLPFANQISVCLVMLLYAGAAVVLTLITPHTTHVLGAALPFAFEKLQWYTFKWIIVGGSFFGFYTSLVGVPFQLFRVINAMANDGLLLRCLGNGYNNGKAPPLAIITGSLLSIISAGLFDFETLVKLTVLATLFASTIVAIDIIMLRYVSHEEATGNILEETISQPVSKLDTSLSEIMKLFFRFTSLAPTKLTERIVIINLVLFCTASIGLAVVFTVFSEILMDGGIEAVLPAAFLLAIMLINVASITCQPKSPILTPFRVPLVPLVPCLSIFLNILLMILIGPLSIVQFIIWMTAGILPHLFWYSIKFLRGDIGNNSLYEINKLNSIKLNESIWKINTEKKSFYAGAINPVFQDDNGEETFARCEVYKKESLNSETSAIAVKEKAVQAEKSTEYQDHNKAEAEVIGKKPVDKDEAGQWRCVAEVHTGEDSPEESYEVEMVDKTYDFLSDMTEDFSRDEESSTSSGGLPRRVDDRHPSTGSGESFKSTATKPIHNLPDTSTNSPKHSSTSTPESTKSEPHLLSPVREKEKEDSNREKRRRKTKSTGCESPKKSKNNDDRAKAFKDKLNVLLKNQMNMTNPFRDAILNYEEEHAGDKIKHDSLPKNIKTLNKSQMRDTLEILLAKGPPKRYSLRNSFNIKTTEANAESNANIADESDKT